MAYIYKISNDINNKVYIGKTEFNIQKRWREHCNDYNKSKHEHRPLYKAMQKYGIEHFSIELIEQTDEPELREIYWIDYYDSYHNGYNATRGGDGKKYLDYQEIINEYVLIQNINMVAEKMHCSPEHIANILKFHNIEKRDSTTIIKESYTNKIFMIDKNTSTVIRSFESAHDAATYVLPKDKLDSNIRGAAWHISEACSGKRQSAYGYYWKCQNGPIVQNQVNLPIKICQYDKNLNYIRTFNSYGEAAKSLINDGVNASTKQIVSCISMVAKGKRKSCYGYIWKNE